MPFNDAVFCIDMFVISAAYYMLRKALAKEEPRRTNVCPYMSLEWDSGASFVELATLSARRRARASISVDEAKKISLHVFDAWPVQ